MSKESSKKKDTKKTAANSKSTKKDVVEKNAAEKKVTKKNTVEKNTTNKKNTKESKANVKEIKKEAKKKIEQPEEIEYDEDLDYIDEYEDEDYIEEDEEELVEADDEIEDEEEEVKIELVEDKKKKEKSGKKTSSEKEIKKEKIEKIEKKVKDNKKKKNKVNFDAVIDFFEKNHLVIYGFIGGVILTTLIAFIIWPDRIAALKNGEEPVVKVGGKNYTADYLYEVMKDTYSVSLLLNEIDSDLLTKIYPEDDEMTEEVESNANYYFDTYEQYYGYTQEEFLEQNGFASLDEFLDYLKLDYRRSKYLDDYITDNLEDKEIEKYYDENVFGDINTQHILVEVSSSDDDGKLSDEDAKTMAEEIISKLNDGTSWEDIQEEYKDDITFEDLGYQSWDASLEDSFMEALVDMDDNSYSEDPVKTSYGYHVIYRLDQKDTPKLKEVKEDIIDNLITEKKSEDSNLLYKALISLREEKNIKFSDTVMKEKYESYCKQYK